MQRKIGFLVLLLATVTVAQPLAGQAQTAEAVQFVAAEDTDGLLERPARLDVENVPLSVALTQLGYASGVGFAFSPSLLPDDRLVACACAAVTIKDALDRLLADTGLRYVVLGSQVVVEETPRPVVLRFPTTVATLSWTPVPVSQMGASVDPAVPPPSRQGTITGSVTDGRNGQPMRGAQVSIQGTGLGTLTNDQGRFVIENVEPGEYEVQAQFLGYRAATQTVTVVEGQEVEVNFELATSAIGLDAVVVTGTPGATARRELGVAIEQVGAADILETAPVTSVNELLANRAPGTMMFSQGGQVGAGAAFKLRGTSSFALTGQPIIYVDGVRVDRTFSTSMPSGGSSPSRLDDLNVDDIESIEIIKGPAASTLYGTEASNGVVQIITKQGAQGSGPELTMAIEQGANWFKDPVGAYGLNYWTSPEGEVISQSPLADWIDAGNPSPFRTGHHQSYSLSVRGGGSNVGYYASARWEDREGYFPTNELERLTARANLNVQVMDNLAVTSSMGLVTSGVTRAPEGGSANFGVITATIWGSPITRNEPLGGFLRAPVTEGFKADIGQDVENFTWSIETDYRLFDWLDQRLTLGTNIVSERGYALWPRMPEGLSHWFAQRALGERRVQNVLRRTNTLDYAATASFDLNPDVNLATSFGIQYYARTENFTESRGELFPTPGLETVSSAAERFGEESFLENTTIGFYLQERVALGDRVFLTAALRADDNSAFGADVDPAFYPKLSGVWVLSDEGFWDFSWMNELRLRGAWGMAGQQPDAFAAIRTFEPIAGVGGEGALVPGAPGNPELKPERGQELELGFDASFVDERVGLNFTYYNQRTKDAIVARQAPPSGGFTGAQFVNLGEVRNWGVELAVNSQLIETSGFSWDLGANIHHTQNELVSLGGIPPINTGQGRQQIWHMEGYPVGGFWNRQVVQAEMADDGSIVNVLCDGGPGNAPMPCDEAPNVFLGGPGPDWDIVANTGVNLGENLRLTALVDMKFQQRKMNIQRYCRDYCFNNGEVPHRRDPADAKLLAAIDLNILGPAVERIDWVKLREIGASYQLPGPISQRFLRARRASIHTSVRNLWDIWTHPENTHMGNEEEIQTQETWIRQTQTVAPPQALFIARLQVTF